MKTYFKFGNVNKIYFRSVDGTEFELNTKDEMIELRDRLLRYFDATCISDLVKTSHDFKPINPRIFL